MEPTSIVLVGYGKMGQTIDQLAKGSTQWQIKEHLDSFEAVASYAFSPQDVAIEFTTPETCVQNLTHLLSHRVPVVCGTTGWYDELETVQSLVQEHRGSFLYASNFSIGVHLFWQTLEALATKMQHHADYDVSLREVHHLEKKDTPSGTAKTTQALIQQAMPRIQDVPIEALRKENVFGDHAVTFESPIDRITLEHHAKSREGFAMGALRCARWLAEHPGFWTIEDFMKETQ